jgi:hypothetical protein
MEVVKKPARRSNLPPEAAKNLERHIREKSRDPGDRLERRLAEQGGGISVVKSVEPEKLRCTLTFADKSGELGRVDAVYSGPNLSLSALLCGVRDGDPDTRAERERVMAEIYETAKSAFAEK